MCGWVSTSKKSAERRCVSRCSWLVSMLAASMVPVTEVSPSASVVIEPEKVENRPRTVAITMCLTEKPMLEWEGSMFQVPAGTRVRVAGAAVVAIEVAPLER